MVTGATLVQLPKRWHCPTLEAIFMAPVTIRRHPSNLERGTSSFLLGGQQEFSRRIQEPGTCSFLQLHSAPGKPACNNEAPGF